MSRPIPTVALAVLLVLSGCGSGDAPAGEAAGSSAQPTPTRTPPTPTGPESSALSSPGVTQPAVRGTVIVAADSDFGTMLFDDSRQAIYLFDRETSSTPDCYGACAEAWPPVLTKAPPRARGDVRPSLLGTTTREDGSLQVTYAGHPLYFYAHEGKNQVLCHDVEEYGGTWLVVTPGGDPAPV